MAFYDLIKFDGNGLNWLMYEHPVDEFNNNSKLVVSPGQVAIIVHSGKIEKFVRKVHSRLIVNYFLS